MILKNFVINLATLFGLGNFPIMPGTLGSFMGLLLHIILIQNLSIFSVIFTLITIILLAIVICDMAEKVIGEKDPGCVILDEFVAMPICFLGIKHFIPATIAMWKIWVLGFVIFRIFDILKPLGIKKSQDLSGGIGIVVDDIIAAVYTNVTMILICLTIRGW
ncbi:MAG: phosphatidylglycerophosphatase A [Puniceicoccales bacterium]|jgi:phosphatidylglycerophosphatase A|nr:phosphatidylglycerophosphatase A [Puniceicoccales bacterium]